MTGRPACDVVGCAAPPIGSYLSAGPAGAAEFAICQTHFSKMQAGQRPVVVEAPVAEPGPAGHLSLMLD